MVQSLHGPRRLDRFAARKKRVQNLPTCFFPGQSYKGAGFHHGNVVHPTVLGRNVQLYQDSGLVFFHVTDVKEKISLSVDDGASVPFLLAAHTVAVLA